MSVRAELEELVKWISDLSAEREPEPSPQPVVKDAWERVRENLKDASETFEEAAVALEARAQAGSNEDTEALKRKQRASLLAEVARDLEHEAEGLSLRARVLARRAPLVPKAKPPKGTLSEVKREFVELKSDLLEMEIKLTEKETDLKRAETNLEDTKDELEKTVVEFEKVAPDAAGQWSSGAAKRAAERAKVKPQPKPKKPKASRGPAEAVGSAEGTIETALKNLATEGPDVVSEMFAQELDLLAEMALSLRQQLERLG